MTNNEIKCMNVNYSHVCTCTGISINMQTNLLSSHVTYSEELVNSQDVEFL